MVLRATVTVFLSFTSYEILGRRMGGVSDAEKE